MQARAESIADQPASTTLTVVTAAQAVDFVNDGIRALYHTIVDIHPDFRVTIGSTFTFTNPNSVNSTTIPADFHSVRAVVSDPGTPNRDILQKNALRAGMIESMRSYRLQGTLLYIEPSANAAGSYQLWYTPTAPILAAGATALDSELEQFQDVIVFHAAILMLTKQAWTDEIALLSPQLAMAMGRAIKWAGRQRDANPAAVEDVRSPARRLVR